MLKQATQPSSHSKIQHLQVITAGNLNHTLRQPCAILPRGGLRGLELQGTRYKVQGCTFFGTPCRLEREKIGQQSFPEGRGN